MQPNQLASQEEWLAARRALLIKEKAHMRAGDALAAERRSLPWLKIEKTYTFDTPNGPRTYRRRMQWDFDWVSSYGQEFNYDFHVSFTPEQISQGRIEYNSGTITVDPRYASEELPGVSVFASGEDGAVFLTYSTFARGLDMLLTADHYLDLTPEGRNEKAYPGWPRRHDEYPEKSASDAAAACCSGGG